MTWFFGLLWCSHFLFLKKRTIVTLIQKRSHLHLCRLVWFRSRRLALTVTSLFLEMADGVLWDGLFWPVPFYDNSHPSPLPPPTPTSFTLTILECFWLPKLTADIWPWISVFLSLTKHILKTNNTMWHIGWMFQTLLDSFFFLFLQTTSPFYSHSLYVFQ